MFLLLFSQLPKKMCNFKSTWMSDVLLSQLLSITVHTVHSQREEIQIHHPQRVQELLERAAWEEAGWRREVGGGRGVGRSYSHCTDLLGDKLLDHCSDFSGDVGVDNCVLWIGEKL